MSSRRRLSQNLSASSNKLRLDSLNKIFKIDSSKGKKHRRETIAKQVSRVALSELLHNDETSNSAYLTKDIPDFNTFLANKDNLQEFREFLKTQYCQENLDFYLACEKYRRLDPERVGNDLIKLMATQIFNDYLGESARQPVNLNYDCLQSIIRRMRDPKADLLCDAQTEIYNLMKTDCYPRFCKTWRLDRETARKILCDRRIESTPSNRTAATTITNNSSIANHTAASKSIMSMTSNSLGSQRDFTHSSLNSSVHSRQLPQNRGFQRKVMLQSNMECPQDCPYFRIGLPCQQHNVDEDNRTEERGTSDLIDKIDLSRIHHVPNCCTRRNPPPPPLPPKPDTIEFSDSPVINKKFCPYVGKVFNV